MLQKEREAVEMRRRTKGMALTQKPNSARTEIEMYPGLSSNKRKDDFKSLASLASSNGTLHGDDLQYEIDRQIQLA